ncbi:MAG: DUF1761 domain-containing protein [Hyphomicrobiales bacterium]
MDMLTTNISWIAVLVGAVVSFMAGWLWYSPILFGPKWAEGVGVEMGRASEMPVSAMVFQGVGLLLMSWFIGALSAENLTAVAVLGTISFVALAYSGGLFAKKSAYARFVDAGYWIISLIVMVIVQSLLGGGVAVPVAS